jgi:hypothetical protein
MTFPTAHLTRPLVILSVYGWVHAYFQQQVESTHDFTNHNYDFGSPKIFVPQRNRLRSTIGLRARVLGAELARVLADRFYRLKLRLRGSG